MSNRAALYIDGFNMYHAIDDLKQPHLKWLNLWKLGEIIAGSRGNALVKAVYCSAFYPGDHSKWIRHNAYKAALELAGVKCVMGHYVKESKGCRKCSHTWEKPSEKETDISVALAVILDGYDDAFDVAYLLTADSDQAATARAFKARFPEKKLVSVAPPGRKHSQHILAHTSDNPVTLDADLLERALFGPVVTGSKAVRRPFEYDPPKGWVHPDQRPQKAKGNP